MKSLSMGMKLMPQKPIRLLLLFGALGILVAGEVWYRHWTPTSQLVTDHYAIHSSATPEQTRSVAEVIEKLHSTYKKEFCAVLEVGQTHPKLQMKLFKDRPEFRRCHRGLGWAEAYYKYPYCQAYFSEDANPYQWMIHEAVHQLNNEVGHLPLEKWSDEGIAEYFSTSILINGELSPGKVNRNCYPMWWFEDLVFSGNMSADIASNKFIPLRVILTDEGGPDMDDYFNLYYIHWWSLTHFLFNYESGKYRAGYFKLMRSGGKTEDFEKEIGPIENVEKEWYGYFRQQKWQLFRQAKDRVETGKGR